MVASSIRYNPIPHRAWNLGLTALCKSVNISCCLWLFNVKAILVCPDITSCLKIFVPFKLINSEKETVTALPIFIDVTFVKEAP